ncbi:MAG: translation initiation factor IF-2 [Chlamydiales bacterium]|nr:translation initiation factor IF-2 [Chlamydiales bacterium]
MAKNLKINIKNTQISKAVDLKKLKSKLAKQKSSQSEEEAEKKPKAKPAKKAAKTTAAKKSSAADKKASTEQVKEAPPERKVKARTKSAFEVDESKVLESTETSEQIAETPSTPEQVEPSKSPVIEENKEEITAPPPAPAETPEITEVKEAPKEETPLPQVKQTEQTTVSPKAAETTAPAKKPARPKLGPTGRHINDLIRKEPPAAKSAKSASASDTTARANKTTKDAPKQKEYKDFASLDKDMSEGYKSYKDISSKKKKSSSPKSFDSRDRMGLRSMDDSENSWRKKKNKLKAKKEEQITIRPSSLHVRLPVSIKDLASQMKLKASQLIAKLLMQGLVVTLNDYLDDETTIQLLGHEFQCDIQIDTTEEDRIRITDKTVAEEIASENTKELQTRPPIITFMGHVDHGKTSLIDAIRKSNIVAGEAGAITQHTGAFKVSTSQGSITVLDTPGHEAFSAMRARGANLTDIVVLVIAGDEGVKQQTQEAINHAKAAAVPIIVAINKSDKPGYNPENVYRQLADNDLLPESWGGQIITVNCSAVSREGLPQLLEMLALQAEVLEIKANPAQRARGSVVESQMHKGLGATTTLVVQNGTLKPGDAVVFNHHWGRIKNIYNDSYQAVDEAPPSFPCRVTGISGLPEAGDDFIVVKDEKEAKDIAEAREEDNRQNLLKTSKKLPTLESLLQTNQEGSKKTLNVIIRADVQGTLEALQASLMKIDSEKVELQIIHQGIGDISESDLQLAAASKALILGFHTHVESRAEALAKTLGVQVKLHKIIYEAIDDIKALMAEKLDKIVHEDERGNVEVKAIFKASQLGKIAGCQVKDGSIKRNHKVKLIRDGEVLWKGNVASLKREKDDVKEVQKGMECGILLDGFTDFEEGDIIQSYELRYEAQEL